MLDRALRGGPTSIQRFFPDGVEIPIRLAEQEDAACSSRERFGRAGGRRACSRRCRWMGDAGRKRKAPRLPEPRLERISRRTDIGLSRPRWWARRVHRDEE